ncbi:MULTISPECIES: DHA2 family efflux MFS transporter permease subunit [Novosphingobium]|jgi:DHA2 family multidrug resistance protein|uniref:DHA2 family efflux MFS transporter permease subunit n=3 Tax=Novosphingobium TaxID=165696 RepID=A0A7Y0GAB6_9SPHN|nr:MULTISPECIES: DHA2 family efflux MFS transporter permease subunit [Novosphingobium]AAD03860.1 putative aromatic efflux pump inner membrane protein [Novosphingobium aromaticivorans]ABP64146.1 drug resistance transporter, EmrB/QacA subfamily [Novosphingobium aromaticivorans DSM 12444]NML95091.1 DHA2 family efflux MFS transporter permease subunit [Novosphingobium olei]QOV96576.1 DHA2 family efflux MFS transporter permease subunit [Novosphingobium sp. ES2-1]SCY83692.1 MFS transporter, DHA2 fami
MSETASSGAGIAPSRQLVAGLVLALANFMVILDLSIANVSIPHIAGNLGITLEQGAWVITSYAVAEAICVPLTGWVAGRFGSVRTFLFSMVGFGICSFLCGISVTMGMLVASRIGQGIFGAFLMPMSQTLLLSVFPPEKRNMAMGLWAVTLLMGPALGPMIGGYLTENYSWHWIFLINVPVAILCIVVGFALLRPIETERQILPIDYVGLALLVLWVGCLQIVLDLGRNHDWFADPMIVALTITSAVGFIVFIIWELGEDHPIVDLRVLRHRGFSVSLTVLSLAFAGYFAAFVVVPQWQQAWLGFPATAAGLSSSFSAMGGLITVPLVAFLMSRLDLRFLVSCGVTWIAAMTLVRTTWTTDSDFWTLSIPQFVQGLGTPFMMLPLMTLTLNTVKENEVASAAGLQSFMRTIATAVATSITLSYWGDTQRIARSDAVAVLQPEAAQASLSSLGFPSEQIRQVLSNMVELEATTLALIHTFWATTAVLLFAAALIWLAPRPSKSGGITMGH